MHPDDVRNLQDDAALGAVLDLKQLPGASAMGNCDAWVARSKAWQGWCEVNRAILKAALCQVLQDGFARKIPVGAIGCTLDQYIVDIVRFSVIY